jgi:hypothetical protein
MKFEVAAAALIGTRQTRFSAGTLNTPPPMPSSPERFPARNEIASPAQSRSTR